MTRYRARPSFTVEIKRTRPSPVAGPGEPGSLPLPSEPAPKPAGRGLWAGTGLIEEAQAATQSGRFDEPAAPPPPQRRAAASSAPARRVLPSLIAPPEPPAPEPEPVPEEDEPIFRRRRPVIRKAAAPAPAPQGFVWPEDWPDEPPAPAPSLPAPVPAPSAFAAAPRPDAEVAPRPTGEAAPRPKRREDDLRVGERWKRRLPRYCR